MDRFISLGTEGQAYYVFLTVYLEKLCLLRGCFINAFIITLSSTIGRPKFDYLPDNHIILNNSLSYVIVGLAFGMKESAVANNIFTILNILVVIFVVIAGSIKGNLIWSFFTN